MTQDNNNSSFFYKKHVFCCVNQKSEGKECCAAKGASPLKDYMKKKCTEEMLEGVRINNSGCLGRCKQGKVMVIYPEGIWYHYEDEKDIDRIIEEHLKNNRTVEDLRI